MSDLEAAYVKARAHFCWLVENWKSLSATDRERECERAHELRDDYIRLQPAQPFTDDDFLN